MEFILLIIGFICLIKGADYFVEGSSSIAKKFNIPSMIIGLTIVAMGTSAPEASVSITSSLIGQNDMSVANVVGSNIFNILLITGVSSMINKLPVSKATIERDTPILLGSCIMTLLFTLNVFISRFEGIIFLLLATGFLILMIKGSRNNNESNEVINELSLKKTLFYIVIGLVGIILGGRLTVLSASSIATQFGLSQNLIGLTIVAIGTSLPEFMTSVIATKKGELDIAIGNVIGSNIFNILLILGIAATLSPITISIEAVIDVLFMTASTLLIFINIKRNKYITKKDGIFYILIYISYLIYTILR